MKKLTMYLAIAAITVLFLTSCSNNAILKSGGKSIYPPEVVGVWQADDANNYKWAFKIEPNGSIPKFIHVMGMPIKVSEGGYYEEGPQNGTHGTYFLGPCETEYNPKTRELKITVILNDFEMVLPQGTLAGKSEDYFTGNVSEDGKTYIAKWISINHVVGADEPNIPGIRANPVKITFTKLDLNNLPIEDPNHKHN